MAGGTNGPQIYDGIPYQYAVKTLSQLRTKLMIRLGFAAQLASPPSGMTELLNSFIIEAQDEMYHRYSPLRNMRWWTIPIQQGERHYGIPSLSTGAITVDFNDNAPMVDTAVRTDGGSFVTDGITPGMVLSCVSDGVNDQVSFVVAAVTATTLTMTTEGAVTTATGETVTLTTVNYQTLDERRISEQWILDGSTWNQMSEGIDPGLFNSTSQGYPLCYEWTNHLEVWPTPDKAYTIYVKGHFGLMPFEADTDVTTIDWNLVYLDALATAKSHYGQNDAGVYFRKLEVLLNKLTGEKHGNKRYIPNAGPERRVLSKPAGTWR